MHLTIDGWGGVDEFLGNKEMIRAFLDSFPAEIGMTKISEPYVTSYSAAKSEDSGVTGFVIIAESHISIHTYPLRGRVWADVFSCKDFDTNAAIDAIGQLFDLEQLEANVQSRSLDASPLAPTARSHRYTAAQASAPADRWEGDADSLRRSDYPKI